MAKHLKKLKRLQKQLLTANKYNRKDYLYERDTTDEIVFVNQNTKGKLIYLKKEGTFKY